MITGKTLIDHANLFSPCDFKKMVKQHTSILKTNIASLDFMLKKIDETRNCLLEEMKDNDLMSKKHKKCVKLWAFSNFNFWC